MENKFFQVTEEIYREGYFNGRRSLFRVTDISGDSLKEAKVYAFGYVANRMLTLKKLQEEGVLPNDGLEAFLSTNADTDFELHYQTFLIGAAKEILTADGKPLNHFEKSDKVIWQIDLVTGDESPKWNQVYDSSRDSRDSIDELLKDAISEAGEVEVDNQS